jgi:hypothetical protein
MCSYLTGAKSTGRAVAPPSAPTPQFGKDGARMEEVCRFAGSKKGSNHNFTHFGKRFKKIMAVHIKNGNG